MVKIKCLSCNQNFQVAPYRAKTAKYCSNTCRIKDKIALKINLQCLSCSKSFVREKYKQGSSHKGQYCSAECYRARSPQQEIECICGKKFKAYQSRISYYNRLFCSQKCYLKNGFFGRLTNDLPEVSNYGKFVAKLRSSADYLRWKQARLDIDNYTCKVCEETNNLTVHHKISIYDFVKKYGLNKNKIEKDCLFYDLNNGVTLCRACHLNEHRKKDE